MGPGLDTRAVDELPPVTWNPACRINSEPNLSTPSILWRHSWGASGRSVRLVHRIKWRGPLRQLDDGDWLVQVTIVQTGELAEYRLSRIVGDPDAV